MRREGWDDKGMKRTRNKMEMKEERARWVVENSFRTECGGSDARLSMKVDLSWNGRCVIKGKRGETEGRAESEI